MLNRLVRYRDYGGVPAGLMLLVPAPVHAAIVRAVRLSPRNAADDMTLS